MRIKIPISYKEELERYFDVNNVKEKGEFCYIDHVKSFCKKDCTECIIGGNIKNFFSDERGYLCEVWISQLIPYHYPMFPWILGKRIYWLKRYDEGIRKQIKDTWELIKKYIEWI